MSTNTRSELTDREVIAGLMGFFFKGKFKVLALMEVHTIEDNLKFY